MYKISLQQSLRTKNILPIIVLHLAIGAIICVLIFIRFPCPFKFIFGIPCPACGTLHALRAIVFGDFYGYIKHNYLAIPMVLAFWLGIHKKTLLKNRPFVDIFICVTCIFITIRYFLLIFCEHMLLLEV